MSARCCAHRCSSLLASSSARAFSTVPHPKSAFHREAAPKSAPPSSLPRVKFDQPRNITYPQNQVQSTRTTHAHNTGQPLRRTSLKGAFANARYRTSVARIPQLPPKGALQEIVFAGRSNVGKSSLINALVCSDSLVKTSQKAGCTRMLNFFDVPGQMVLVDAPGYGDKGRPEWGALFSHFVTQRPPSPPSLLIALYPLGHTLNAADQLFLASLPPALPVLPVLTKCDLVQPHEIDKRKKALEQAIKAARSSAWTEEDDATEPVLLEAVCVSTQRRYPLRDEMLEHMRKTILDHLDQTAAAHQAAQLRHKDQTKAAQGDRR